MKNYKQTASDVLRLVGGEKNVVQVEHCSTRLRFTLADSSKVDAAALKKTAGVMGVISSGPQCQVVIGNDVIEVYDELLKLGTFNAGQAAAPAAPKGKKEIGGIILDYMVGIFQPLVPAIAGAGVLKALMVLLSTLGLMSSGDIAYKVFVGVADGHCRKAAAGGVLHPPQLSAHSAASGGMPAGGSGAAVGLPCIQLGGRRQEHPDDGLPCRHHPCLCYCYLHGSAL